MKNPFFKTVIIISLLFLISNCTSNDDIELSSPSVANETTNANAEVTYTTVKISGKVISDGGSEISSKGVCWSKNPNPTINDNKITESDDVFSSVISDLMVNTTYYFRIFATNNTGTAYSEEQSFSTLTLDNTSWKFTTVYQNNFEIYSQVDLLDDHTTKFDEMDLPGQCPGCFITYGNWSVNGNELTYIWEGSDPANSTYIYTGIISGMNIQGNYTHSTSSNGSWSAIQL